MTKQRFFNQNNTYYWSREQKALFLTIATIVWKIRAKNCPNLKKNYSNVKLSGKAL